MFSAFHFITLFTIFILFMLFLLPVRLKIYFTIKYLVLHVSYLVMTFTLNFSGERENIIKLTKSTKKSGWIWTLISRYRLQPLPFYHYESGKKHLCELESGNQLERTMFSHVDNPILPADKFFRIKVVNNADILKRGTWKLVIRNN